MTIRLIVKSAVFFCVLSVSVFAGDLNDLSTRSPHAGDPCYKGITPGAAAWRSAVFPGWGQYRNGAALKSGILATINSIFLFESIRYSINIEHAFKTSRSRGETSEDLAAGNAPYFERYSELFDKRTDLYWMWGLLYLFAVTDAYVDSYLSCFNDEMAEFPYIEGEQVDNNQLKLKFGLRFLF